MNASLTYYKGYNLRENYPYINKWLTQFEASSTYRGTQGDFHTHAHDLPPQMGGCYKTTNEKQTYFSDSIDNGQGLGNFEFNIDLDSNFYAKIALQRVLRHKNNLIKSNPYDKDLFDESLRSALTYMIIGELKIPKFIAGKSLRFLKNRISVPRDMPAFSARLLRQSLKKIESFNQNNDIPAIPTRHRYDQDPKSFVMD